MTHESAKRRGYGTMLLDAGNKMADDMDYPIYLDASKEGMPIYLKAGYQELDIVKTSPSTPMMRPRKSERV